MCLKDVRWNRHQRTTIEMYRKQYWLYIYIYKNQSLGEKLKSNCFVNVNQVRKRFLILHSGSLKSLRGSSSSSSSSSVFFFVLQSMKLCAMDNERERETLGSEVRGRGVRPPCEGCWRDTGEAGWSSWCSGSSDSPSTPRTLRRGRGNGSDHTTGQRGGAKHSPLLAVELRQRGAQQRRRREAYIPGLFVHANRAFIRT